MKRKFFSLLIFVVLVCLTVILYFYKNKKMSINLQTKERASFCDFQQISMKNPMDKRKYWGSINIENMISHARSELTDKSDNKELTKSYLHFLGMIGSTEAISIMKEFLEKNEKLLPPNETIDLRKEPELVMITGMPIKASPMTVEEKIACVIENLSATAFPDGEQIANEAVLRIKAKYQGTEYGKKLADKLDFAVRNGKALSKYHIEMRKLPI